MKRLPILTTGMFLILVLAAVVFWVPERSVRGVSTAMAVVDAEGQTAPEAESAAARSAVRDARRRLGSYQSIQASLVERVKIGDRRFALAGKYIQGQGLRLRLELATQFGKTSGALLEVSDGNILWIRRAIGGQETVIRRDVRRILDAAEERGVPASSPLVADLAVGGLPGLLASLEHSLDFQSREEREISDREFVVVEGVWNASFLEESGLPGEGSLPEFIPNLVRIYLDGENLFPRRIQYFKTDGGSSESRELVTLDFREIRLNGALSPDEFEFLPSLKAEARDDTGPYIKRITGK